jgi:hypothetical protein
LRILLLLALLPGMACAELMLPPFKNGDTSYVSPCFPLWSVAAPAETLTGVTGSTANLAITLQTDNASAATSITTNTNILTLGTVGTYSAPTSNTRVRFGECSASSGMYQLMLHNDQVGVAGAGALTIRISDTGDTFLDQVLIINQDVADLNDIGDTVEDTLENAEVETGLTYKCAMAVIKAITAGEFTRVAGSGSAGTTTYLATDDTTTRVIGTINTDVTTRSSVTITCP